VLLLFISFVRYDLLFSYCGDWFFFFSSLGYYVWLTNSNNFYTCHIFQIKIILQSEFKKKQLISKIIIIARIIFKELLSAFNLIK